MSKILPSNIDTRYLKIIRRNITEFMKRSALHYANRPGRLLDIAPQVYEGASPFFPYAIVETLDIDSNSGCTYIGDICKCNNILPDNKYDYVVCTEVLEHTLRPWDAVNEIYRILKPQGLLFLSVPFNFRIHGPLPDCWRFTEHGLRAILRKFEIVELNAVETPNRPLMPIHYTLVARKPAIGDASW